MHANPASAVSPETPAQSILRLTRIVAAAVLVMAGP
jgi:hypothetical protein